jgi:hypothetical protein
MSRKPNIRWGESDLERLNKEVKRFNAKVYRTKKAHPELENILPKTIKKDDKAKLIEDLKLKPRAEFKKEVNSLARFSKRGAEKIITSKTGNTVTNWEKKEVGLKVAQINRERTRERKAVENMDATSRGEKIGMKRGQMGSERLNELKPKKFDFNKIKGGKEWEKFKASVDKQVSPVASSQRMEDYKNNYIKAMVTAYGDYANDIIEIIKELPADVIVNTYYAEQEATITFHYELIEMNTKLEILNDIWVNAKEEHDNENNR